MEVYLRLMFLKFRYRLGYESLCREVADSITWRRFCRIPLDGRVPHPTTLMKLDHPLRHGGGGWVQRGAAGQGRGGEAAAHQRLRADTTVVAADRGLPDRLRAAGQGGAPDRRGWAAGAGRRWRHPHRLRDRSRSAGRRAREIGAKLRLRAHRPETKPRPRSVGSPASWPDWPSEPLARPRPRRCWPMPGGRCPVRTSRPLRLPRPGSGTPSPGGGAADCAGRSTT